MALIQAKPAFVRLARPHITVAREVRSRDARNARPTRVQALVPCAFFEKFLTGCGGAANETLRHGQLPRVKAIQPARLQRARKMRGDARRMKTEMMKPAFGRAAHTHHGFNAKDVRRKQIAPAGVDGLRHAHRARQRAGGRMHNRAHMRVVVIQAMHQRAVHQHRVAQRQFVRHTDQATGTAARNTADARQDVMRKGIVC